MPEKTPSVGDVIAILRSIAPEEHALSWDRVGLQLGNPSRPARRLLATLELTDPVVTEAERWKAGLLVLHHPVIYEPLETLREDSAAGIRLCRLVRGSVGVYVLHTNFDASPHSMSAEMLRRVGVKRPEPVAPKPNVGNAKIVVFCPREHTDRIRTAMGAAGAGVIGEYELCSYSVEGTGTFRGSEASSPFVGEAGKFERAVEDRLEMICSRRKVPVVVTAMVRAHPYEEPAYDIYPLEDFLGDEHFLWTGELQRAVRLDQLAREAAGRIAGKAPVQVIGAPGKRVRILAAASGGGKSLLSRAASLGADCLLTGELGHHASRTAEDLGLNVIAVGHYSSEVAFGPTVARLLRKRLTGVEVRVARSLRPPFQAIS